MTIPPESRQHVAELVLDPETRSGDAMRLKGYAAVFNTPSDWIGFREVLEPGAFRATLSRGDRDVSLLWSHDRSRPLARQSAGTLKLREDKKGLYFEATLPNTTLARDAMEMVRAGLVTQMSFGFTMRGGRERTEERGGEIWRYVQEVGTLHEVSLVLEPAYSGVPAISPRELERELLEVRARDSALLDAIRRRERAESSGPYGPESEYSWFRDRLVASGAPVMPHNVHGDVAAAERRLKQVEKQTEERAVGLGVTDLWSVNAPGYISDLFVVAARPTAPVTALLASAPLPKSMLVTVPRITSGATVGFQDANTQVSNTDPATAMEEQPVVTVSGYVDVAQQDLEQTGGLVDRAIAVDLAKALGEALEKEVINGLGTPGRMTGLLNFSGTTTKTWTDATPTPAENFSRVGDLYSTVAAAYGQPPDTLVMHSRRRAWVEMTSSGLWPRWPANVVESMGIPTTFTAGGGSGGTEDVVIALGSDEVYFLATRPRIEVVVDHSGSANMTARIVATQYAALLARQPTCIGKLVGTGLTAPVWP